MIIDLYGTVVDNEIQFTNLPAVYFGDRFTVSVTQMFIKLKKKYSNIYGTLCSTLVDRNPINPQQQLLFFNQNNVSYYIRASPTHLADYKIVCPSLDSSVFTLQLSKAAEIEKIYIQLKISDERIQWLNQKKI